MKKTVKTLASLIFMMLALLVGYANAQSQDRKSTSAGKTNVVPAAGSAAGVTGNGTTGQLVKWTSLSTLGDSTISEDKFGKIGIGTTAPTSKLTVQGMIETTLGGLKFPDGTVQTSAAVGLSSIIHNATLTGNGTNASPLAVAVPLNLTAATTNSEGVINLKNTTTGIGLKAESIDGVAVIGFSQHNTGVTGSSFQEYGVYGSGHLAGVYAEGNEYGLYGRSTFGTGVYGTSQNGVAGQFFGNVEISGNLSKGGGSFKIDHPLDPENKYLYHSFVESPDMKNIYDGVAKLDNNGEAVIEMPDWFSALNRDFRYLLTPIGAAAPGLYVAEELTNNRFKVAGGVPGMKVSWQVTGIRQDAWANKNRIPIEANKAEKERGFYLHPEVFNQPEEKNVEWARHPEQMKRAQEIRQKQ